MDVPLSPLYTGPQSLYGCNANVLLGVTMRRVETIKGEMEFQERLMIDHSDKASIDPKGHLSHVANASMHGIIWATLRWVLNE